MIINRKEFIKNFTGIVTKQLNKTLPPKGEERDLLYRAYDLIEDKLRHIYFESYKKGVRR